MHIVCDCMLNHLIKLQWIGMTLKVCTLNPESPFGWDGIHYPGLMKERGYKYHKQGSKYKIWSELLHDIIIWGPFH